MRHNLPRKDLDVLLNVPGFGIRETHDDFEKLLAVRFRLRHRQWPKALEIPTDAILLFNRKTDRDQRLEQVNRVHARDKAFFLLFPPYAAYTDAVWRSLFGRDWFEIRVDGASAL